MDLQQVKFKYSPASSQTSPSAYHNCAQESGPMNTTLAAVTSTVVADMIEVLTLNGQVLEFDPAISLLQVSSSIDDSQRPVDGPLSKCPPDVLRGGQRMLTTGVSSRGSTTCNPSFIALQCGNRWYHSDVAAYPWLGPSACWTLHVVNRLCCRPCRCFLTRVRSRRHRLEPQN